jgi:hypothetical protein
VQWFETAAPAREVAIGVSAAGKTWYATA